MDTILQLTRRLAHNSSPSSNDLKYSPTDSLKLSNRDNKRIERRKPNWTECENIFLLDQFSIHREILTCKATDASTNLRKQEIWRLICANLNQNNTLVRRTPAEVRRKWKNLVTAAKKEVWEMRHQIHMSGGAGGGSNGRKISELSQRVLQLHSSGNSSNNTNGLFGNLANLGGASLLGSGIGDKFLNNHSKYSEYIEDKNFIPAHFTPIITLSESNNNHINLMGANNSDGPPSPMSEEDYEDSSESRNATEFMSDSGIYEQEGIDLRVNVSRNGSNNVNSSSIIQEDEDEEDDDDLELADRSQSGIPNNIRPQLQHHLHHQQATRHTNGPLVIDRQQIQLQQQLQMVRGGGTSSVITAVGSSSDNNTTKPSNHPESNQVRKCSETTEEMSPSITDPFKIHTFTPNSKDSEAITNLYKEKLQLQIAILRLTKRKLIRELKSNNNTTNSSNKKPMNHESKTFLWLNNSTHNNRTTRSKSAER